MKCLTNTLQDPGMPPFLDQHILILFMIQFVHKSRVINNLSVKFEITLKNSIQHLINLKL